MKMPVHIGLIIPSLFGGFPPCFDTIAMARQFRNEFLPPFGVCRKEGSMAMEVFQAICRQINQRIIDPQAVCKVCPRWDCPIQKGTVLF